ncbi:SDR family NAD(P)-dependent oxidoreductase [Rhodococcus fascians]|nr:SDR family NAD(P)-dependent oxidoreductase [Rhodococcus fascians]MBY4238750.1 SDR family NAD(P)-dependent oxidoreductase [Rhodococcus fascians]MBY4254661.1 SDR family NAD(P)-dependent oxidoreductase [Rhodococcus fascians]MBY4270105.1 SDR family NAD(P)-dependent oxidoreductase [Rhodococcus fascians]
MKLETSSAVITGGASGLGYATAEKLISRGASVVIVDINAEAGTAAAEQLGPSAAFVAADVLDSDAFGTALDRAAERAPLRALVHCAGRGATVRVVDRDGKPGSLEDFTKIVELNLIGSYNVLRLAAARMVANEPLDEERGVCVMTSSIAAWEGQIGQTPYAASKAGIVGLTLVAARDLASRRVRVCSIAPGIFDTPILNRLPQEVKDKLAASIPNPSRLGKADEFAHLADAIIGNAMLNGETIRLDGAIRMAPR